jgi:hypothetical protein
MFAKALSAQRNDLLAMASWQALSIRTLEVNMTAGISDRMLNKGNYFFY